MCVTLPGTCIAFCASVRMAEHVNITFAYHCSRYALLRVALVSLANVWLRCWWKEGLRKLSPL